MWRVAAATGRPVPEVARESYALVIWQYARLLDAERIEGALRQFDRIADAEHTMLAMSTEPTKALQRARDELLRKYASVTEQGRAEAEAAARGLAKLRRIRRRAKRRG